MKSLILSLLFLCTFAAHARMFPKGHEPKLDIYHRFLNAIGVNSGITQADFNMILAKMKAKFDPIYAGRGQRLVINNLWNDQTINSDAHWEGNVCIINAYGGLARAPGMTADAYLMVNGHENGHCIGQPPLYPGDNMSDEGQADTYSVDAARIAGLTDAQIDAGAQALSDILNQLGGMGRTSWPGPVLPAVKVTFHDHSDGQCRRDSMMFRRIGVQRPNCWYAGGTPTGTIPGGGPVPIPVPKPNPGPCNCCAVIQQLVHELKSGK
jgi:hypothetical protein